MIKPGQKLSFTMQLPWQPKLQTQKLTITLRYLINFRKRPNILIDYHKYSKCYKI